MPFTASRERRRGLDAVQRLVGRPEPQKLAA